MPKTINTSQISVTTTPTVLQASSGTTRYYIEIATTAQLRVDIGDGSTWLSGVMYIPAGRIALHPPIVVTNARQMRLATTSGTATVSLVWIEQT